MKAKNTTPPAGYDLVVDVPDYGPEVFDPAEGNADAYESVPVCRDGQTRIFGAWSVVDGSWIVLDQNDNEIWVTPYMARLMAADLLAAADAAEA